MQPRARVIIDNDFSGDPDDLFQLVHHVLSPSVAIPFVIGSHLPPHDLGDPSDQQATNAARIARHVLELIGVADRIPVYEGSNSSLTAPQAPIDNQAARQIIAEALRDDTDTPLYVALGAGLTALASALLLEPRIANRLTAIWIGGPEYPDLADPPPGEDRVEYNLSIDVAAGQAVFNHSAVGMWQVPRDVYRQCLISRAELERRVRPEGAVGRYLADAIDRVASLVESAGRNLGETYALGDSPLVLLTALQSAFEPAPSSSAYVTRPMPRLSPEGRYVENDGGRPVRVYTRVDTRLMFEDFFHKLAALAAAQAG
jgi:inosine-uridine nucleoside N-ribohydrolase